MKHEVNSDTNYNWGTWNSSQNWGKMSGGIIIIMQVFSSRFNRWLFAEVWAVTSLRWSPTRLSEI